MFATFSSLIRPAGIFRILFAVEYLMLIFTKCLLAAETCALIHLRGIRCDTMETSHALKREEKIGLKLRLGKCVKTKIFLLSRYFRFF